MKKPNKVVDCYWEYFLESLKKSNISIDAEESFLINMWNGFMLGYSIAVEHEGSGVDFYYHKYICVDCEKEFDEETDGYAHTFFKEAGFRKPISPLCAECNKKRKNKKKKH